MLCTVPCCVQLTAAFRFCVALHMELSADQLARPLARRLAHLLKLIPEVPAPSTNADRSRAQRHNRSYRPSPLSSPHGTSPMPIRPPTATKPSTHSNRSSSPASGNAPTPVGSNAPAVPVLPSSGRKSGR